MTLRIEAERKLIHLALVIIPLAAWLGSTWLPGLVAPMLWAGFALGLALDLARRSHSPFRGWIDSRVGHLIRPHEEIHLLGSTLYLFGIALAFTLFRPSVALAASGFLVIGDAVAALVGTRFGRWRSGNGKSMEGAAACLAACLVVGTLVARLDPTLGWPARTVGATAAALSEFVAPRGYDNVAVPLVAGLVMTWLAR